MSEYILSQGYGYGFAVGLGAAFALIMICITRALDKYAGDHQDSENFVTASRSVKQGLLASAVVSSWTWPATLLTSGQFAYTYGISGPYWYGTTGTFCVVLYVLVAIEIKRVAPGSHTIAEIVKIRFGKAGHSVFLGYIMATNIIVSVMLLLGGSQAFNATTGMNIEAACLLLPLGVIVYTILGGIKATFISDYIHTVIIYVIIIVCMFVTYSTSKSIGSPSKMYDLLTEMGKQIPSPSGKDGSYLTFKNPVQVMTMWCVNIGGITNVFLDASYGQKAIAASPKSILTGYLMGGVAWFIVPFALGTSAGLAALALTNNPVSPTYPNPISTDDLGKGLPVIYGMAAILGKSGAAGGLVMLFMSVTSATSAELIGFSSVVTYDIYRAYINPNASGKTLIHMNHLTIAIWGIAMGALAIGFNYAGVTVGWLLNVTGLWLAPANGILVMAVYYKKMNKLGMMYAAPMGTATGVAVWIGATKGFMGIISKDTLIDTKPAICANFIALFSSPFYAYVLSFFKKETFDFDTLADSYVPGDDATKEEIKAMEVNPADDKMLIRFTTAAKVIAVLFLLIFYFLIPMPMYGTGYIFSKGGFTAWVVVIFIWLLLVSCYITIYPIYESWDRIISVLKQVFGTVSKPQEVVLESENEPETKDSKDKVMYNISAIES